MQKPLQSVKCPRHTPSLRRNALVPPRWWRWSNTGPCNRNPSLRRSNGNNSLHPRTTNGPAARPSRGCWGLWRGQQVICVRYHIMSIRTTSYFYEVHVVDTNCGEECTCKNSYTEHQLRRRERLVTVWSNIFSTNWEQASQLLPWDFAYTLGTCEHELRKLFDIG